MPSLPMGGDYAYRPVLWPLIVATALLWALTWIGWQRRRAPGALSFVVMSLSGALWGLGAVLEVAAVEPDTAAFWAKFQSILAIPAATAALTFALEYANLGQWLARRRAALAIAPLLYLLLAVTNDHHHLLWRGYSVDGPIELLLGPADRALRWGYAFLLALAASCVLLWLFIRSSQHRWPVGLILIGHLVVRVSVGLEMAGVNPVAPLDPVILATAFSSTMYVIVLFRFRMFDPVPVGRAVAIEQMREGMLVLDSQWRVVDLNAAAEKILSLSAAQIKGRPTAQLLPEWDDVVAQGEVTLRGGVARHYALHLSPLRDPHGPALGYLVLLHDVTEEKRAQARLLEKQRVVAALQERELLARELHDSLGQVLGYVSLEAQAIAKWVREGDVATAEAQLARLVSVARDAHVDLRESIQSLRSGVPEGWSFLGTLRQHLAAYQEHYGIRAELVLPPDLGDAAFASGAGVQLVRIIQEALTNARKHSGASAVRVSLARQGSLAAIVVADDGRGFNPAEIADDGRGHLGLAFMRERIAQIGGSLTIRSELGVGTEIALQVPIKEIGEESQ